MNTSKKGQRIKRTIGSVFLTPECDMACRFCASEAVFDVMPLSTARWLVEQLAAHGFQSVVLGGGEPLLWPHGIKNLAAHAHAQGLLVQVCTNATGLNQGLATCESIGRFILPLEAGTAASHDRARFRSKGSHHARVLDTLELLRFHSREVTLSTVVTKENLTQLAQIGAWIEGYKASGARLHGWHLYRFQPIGRHGHSAELDISDREWRTCLDELNRHTLPFKTWVRPDMPNSKSVTFLWCDDGHIKTQGWPRGLPKLDLEDRAEEA